MTRNTPDDKERPPECPRTSRNEEWLAFPKTFGKAFFKKNMDKEHPDDKEGPRNVPGRQGMFPDDKKRPGRQGTTPGNDCNQKTKKEKQQSNQCEMKNTKKCKKTQKHF